MGVPVDDKNWPNFFAAAVNGTHLNAPLGIADVVLGNTGWSVKTVGKGQVTAKGTRVRLISGRNDVNYSYDNDNPLANIQETGNQVLQIWNARVEQATQQYPNMRTIVLIRDMEEFEFTLFEHQTVQYDPANFTWTLNQSGRNIVAHSNSDNIHSFTWQSGGRQFTIIQPMVSSARRFRIRKPEVINQQQVLDSIGYDDSWLTFL